MSGCVNPGSTVRMDWNVRIIKPALTRSTSAIATCTTTIALRTRCRSRLTLVVRPRLPSAAAIRGAVYFTAGINPNNTLDSSDRLAANANVRASTAISLRRGRFGGPIASSTRTPA